MFFVIVLAKNLCYNFFMEFEINETAGNLALTSKVPEKEIIYQRYLHYQPYFRSILELIEAKLKQVLKLSSNPTYKSRVKSFESYYKKILRKHPDAASRKNLVQLTDMMGIRVICAFMEDLSDVERQLIANFDVQEVERKGAEQSFREFGYESVHVLIKIPEDCYPENAKDYPLEPNTVCEIQIRTILQDAWAEVEHELVYKADFSPVDLPLRRKLASINASLTLSDIIFQEIRDYQKKMQSELALRRSSFYEKADELTREQQPELHKSNSQISRPSPYVRGTLDDMILEALHAHNQGNLDYAIVIYTRIVNADPPPVAAVLSVILKHRGMAYFAQSKYDEALADFKESFVLDPKSFKSLYYEGIVYSVKGDDHKAIECFSASLDMDEFQSHVHYRRALAYYNVQEYSKSLEDLAAARKLGLDDDDCKNLHQKLVKKFDMKM